MHLKTPFVGGAFESHRDYAYWYDKYLYPDLVSCLIEADNVDKNNGCLFKSSGERKPRRIEHGRFSPQSGADPQRLAWVEQHHKLVCCVTWHGITISFHANLPHRFDQNESNDLHWSLICVYNAKNNPCEVPPPSQISPRGEVEDDCVKEIGKKDNVTPYNQHKSKARRNQRSMPGPHPAEW